MKKILSAFIFGYLMLMGQALGSPQEYLIYNGCEAAIKSLAKIGAIEDIFSENEKAYLENNQTLSNIVKLQLQEERLQQAKILLNSCEDSRIEINPIQQSFSNDPYLEHQWGLENRGERLTEWISDIDVNIVQGALGEDVNALIEDEKLTPIRVAIVDSGVDTKHPDLKGSFIKKEQECHALEQYQECLRTQADRNSCHAKYASFDSDKNGYPMDCHGWNLSGESIPGAQVQGSPFVDDSDGHGTHVAGIVGARKNGIGIRGVIQNVELIASQVSVISNNGATGEAPTDRIARGILYAIRAGAQVINLSLGWRFEQDSLLMREMIELALKKNILVVAAAGNDAHAAPTYPCSYEGVICVAAHGVDGRISDFSNFGAHVDIMAPGTKILSTWPTTKRSRSFTQNDDYEYLSGTSQAAPFISAVLARLLNQGLTPQEARLKLFKGARADQQKKHYVRHGRVDYQRSLSQEITSFIEIVNKSPALTQWNQSDSHRSFLLKIVNNGKDTASPTVSLSLVSDNSNAQARLIDTKLSFGPISAGETVQKRIRFEAPYQSHAQFVFKVEILSEHEDKEYFIQANAINIIDDSYAKDGAQSFRLHSGEAGSVDLKDANIYPIRDFEAGDTIDFIAIKQSDSKTFVSLIKESEGRYTQSSWKELALANPVFLQLAKVDIDQDGLSEYVLTLIEVKSASERTTRFFVFDSHWELKRISIAPQNSFDNGLAVMPGSFAWIKYDDKKIPFWVGVGERPKNEQPSQGPWDPPHQERKLNRLFLMTPNGLITRPLPKDKETEWIPLHMLYPSGQSSQVGTAHIIAADTYGYHKRYALFRWDGQNFSKLREFSLSPYLDLLDIRPLPLAKAQGDNGFFAHVFNKRQVILAIDVKHHGENEIVPTVTLKEMRLSPGQDVVRVIAFDGKNAIAQTRNSLVVKANSIASNVRSDRIRHTILERSLGLYLRPAQAPGITSELIGLTQDKRLIRDARMANLAVQGCAEIGVTKTLDHEFLSYYCSESKKILRLPLGSDAVQSNFNEVLTLPNKGVL